MPDYDKLLTGPSFTFLIGPTRRAYNVQKTLFKGILEPLDRLVNNGRMHESLEGEVALSDVEPHVFIRLAEYCYTGNYQAPSRSSSAGESKWQSQMLRLHCSCRFSPGQLDTFHVHETHFGHTNCGKVIAGLAYPIHATHNEPPTKSESLWEKFQSRKYGSGSLSYGETLLKLANRDSLSDDFVLHAQLWVFADEWLVDSLKVLCLHKLHRDLVAYDLQPNHCLNLIELIRYTFDNTETGLGIPCTFRGLRELVVHYAACKHEVLTMDPDFMSLLQEGGEFVTDLAVMTEERFQ